ncbi:hypothetical protein ACFY1P_20130 [Streptomyces sp. NPDC001407]|uniref:hypothetical protein n=1 Tax=Streptomyces sp. NPDC001407 TaxID=3364573 RepID=UPI003681E1D7
MSGWERAIADLRAQGTAARAAADRVRELRAGTVQDVRRRTTAVAVYYASEADYLRSAVALLRAHLGDRPPRQLPVARVWPRAVRDLWKERVLARTGGVWRAVPGQGELEQMRSARPGPLMDAVTEQAQALQASLHARRTHPRMYEKYLPAPGRRGPAAAGVGRPSPTLPGFADRGHPVNLALAAGTGIRIQPERLAEASRLKDEEFAVHERALALGDAVLALLVEQRLDGVVPQAGCVRGAGRWVGREEVLVPHRPGWPERLNGFQAVTLAGLGLLVLACAALPLTIGERAGLFSHAALLFTGAAAVAFTGTALIGRTGPRMIKAQGARAAVPGIVAGLAALAVWQGQGSFADYYFGGR